MKDHHIFSQMLAENPSQSITYLELHRQTYAFASFLVHRYPRADVTYWDEFHCISTFKGRQTSGCVLQCAAELCRICTCLSRNNDGWRRLFGCGWGLHWRFDCASNELSRSFGKVLAFLLAEELVNAFRSSQCKAIITHSKLLPKVMAAAKSFSSFKVGCLNEVLRIVLDYATPLRLTFFVQFQF